jgi:hypothetical protein
MMDRQTSHDKALTTFIKKKESWSQQTFDKRMRHRIQKAVQKQTNRRIESMLQLLAHGSKTCYILSRGPTMLFLQQRE